MDSTHDAHVPSGQGPSKQDAGTGSQERGRARLLLTIEIWLGVVAFLFTLNFGYQVIKSDDFRTLVDSAHAQNQLVKTNASRLLAASEVQTEVLSTLILANDRLISGYRDYLLGRYRFSEGSADEAIAELEPLLATLQRGAKTTNPLVSQLRSVGNTSSDAIRSAIDAEASLLKLESTEALQGAAKDALMAAYVLKARSLFAMMSKGDARSGRMLLAPLADKIVALKPDRWEGYHFRAATKYNFETQTAEMKADYRESIIRQPTLNLDRLNLAEMHMVDGEWADALDQINRYAQDDPKPEKTLALLIAFIRFNAETASSDSMPEEHGFCKLFYEINPQFTGTYNSAEVAEYRRRLASGAFVLEPAARARMVHAADLLLRAKPCSARAEQQGNEGVTAAQTPESGRAAGAGTR